MSPADPLTRLSNKQRGLHFLLLVGVLSGLFLNPGCRTARDNQIDILERELRAQEDYIYELEDYIVEYSEKLRQYRCAQMETVVVSKNDGEPELAIPPRSSTNKSAPTTRQLLRSLDEPTESLEDELREETTPETTEEMLEEEILEESIDQLEAPELELEIGEPITSVEDQYESATPLAEAEAEETGTLLADGSFIPDPSAYQTSAVEDAVAEEMIVETASDAENIEEIDEYVEPFEEDNTPTRNREPERLVISHVFENSSEEATSLLSVVEARDASNEPADFNGKVSLMVMQVVDEKPQRVKRWDFTTEETAAAWQSSNLGDGLHLELPLEETNLPAGPLELWVRLETPDGRKLLSQFPFEQATLASIDEAEQHLAEVDDGVAGATHLADANPLRKDEASPIPTKPLQTTASDPKPEPQWRAATHFSNGANSGFATTATAQKWTSRPIGSKAATETATQPAANGSQTQWRARK